MQRFGRAVRRHPHVHVVDFTTRVRPARSCLYMSLAIQLVEPGVGICLQHPAARAMTEPALRSMLSSLSATNSVACLPASALTKRSRLPQRIHLYGSVRRNPFNSEAKPGCSGFFRVSICRASYTFGSRVPVALTEAMPAKSGVVDYSGYQ